MNEQWAEDLPGVRVVLGQRSGRRAGHAASSGAPGLISSE